MADERSQVVREFRVASEWRRITVWLIAGGIVAASSFAGLDALGLWPPPNPQGPPLWVLAVVSSGVFFVPGFICGVGNLRYRLRLDAAGISRRRFLCWDFWPWDAFRNSEVESAGDSGSYRWIRADGTERILRFSFIADADATLVRGVIQKIWVRPKRPPSITIAFPESLTLQIGFRSRMRLTRTGIIHVKGRSIRRWFWSAVGEVRTQRRQRDDELPYAVALELPGQTVTLVAAVIRNYRSILSYPLAIEHIAAHVHPNQIVDVVHENPPLTLREIEIRQAEVEQRLAEQRIASYVCAVLAGLMLLTTFFGMNLWAAKFLSGIVFAIHAIGQHATAKQAEAQLANLDAWRHELQADLAEPDPECGITADLQEICVAETDFRLQQALSSHG